MKYTTLLVAASCFTAQAFGVNARQSIQKIASKPALVNTLNKQSAPATKSTLFRDASVTRGGAVPGWAAYNEALDKNPLTAKSCTSLVGWFLGDLLAQVCTDPLVLYISLLLSHSLCICYDRKTHLVALFYPYLNEIYTMLPIPLAIHRWGSTRHQASHYPLRFWIPLSWAIWSLLLQLA